MSDENKPEIIAQFEDENGSPAFIPGALAKHYTIKLSVKGAPVGATLVTYKLDPTYRQRVRKVPAVIDNFEEYITSYGDYPVEAIIETKAGSVELKENLSSALKKHYQLQGQLESPQILEAISEIETH